MKCPYCGTDETKVVDSRYNQSDNVTRRRRECLQCKERFTTFERVEESFPQIIKRDGRRELYSREKIKSGIRMACSKLPVPDEKIEQIIGQVEKNLQEFGKKEVPSNQIGEWVKDVLKDIDLVAYIRFASVYCAFQDIEDFANELRRSGISVKNNPEHKTQDSIH